MAEGGGISCVAVKCVDIGRNTSGEGDHRANTDTEVRKRGEQTGLDTGSPRRKRCRLAVGILEILVAQLTH